jgi:membrane-bound lytic murein transglycosylase A
LPTFGKIALALALIISVAAAAAMAALVFGGALPPFLRPPITDADFAPPEIELQALSFAELAGWRRDDHSAALPVFLRSCARLEGLADDVPANSTEALGPALDGLGLAGNVGDWRAACAAAREHGDKRYADATASAAAVRAIFEFHFRPLKIVTRRAPFAGGPAANLPDRIEASALVTGYFEPLYQASTFKTPLRPAPVLRRPANLVTLDLGEFRKELAGERLAGYVEDGVLKPFPDHGAINGGALSAGAEAIAWLDANDLFFLQIQGSGRLVLQNGRVVRVGYDGHNGRPYTAVGRLLVERGALTAKTVSMQTIRDWLETASPDEARELREANQSYVFFRELDDLPDPELGPYGADGVQLTTGRSIAVDRRFYEMGAPLWLAVPAVEGRTDEIRRLFVAQDTGGAIKGPLRADIFMGSGVRAGDAAGRMRAEGEMIVFVPRAAAARLEAAGALRPAPRPKG